MQMYDWYVLLRDVVVVRALLACIDAPMHSYLLGPARAHNVARVHGPGAHI